MKNSSCFFVLLLACLPVLFAGCQATGVVQDKTEDKVYLDQDKSDNAVAPDQNDAASADTEAEAGNDTVSAEDKAAEPATQPVEDDDKSSEDKSAEPAPQPSDEAPEDVKAEAIKAAKALDARNLFHKAVLSEKAGDLKTALEYYRKALELDPNYEEANERLTRVRIAMGEQLPEGYDTLKEKFREIEAEITSIRRDVKNRLNLAQEHFRKKEFEKCIRLLEETLSITRWQAYNIDFSAEKVLAKEIIKEARRQQAVIDRAAEEAERTEIQRTLAEEIRNQAEYRRTVARELLDQSRKALGKKNFAEAMSLCQKVLLNDPLNEEARSLETLITGEQMMFEGEKIKLDTSIEWRDTFIKVRQAAIPPSGIMVHPPKDV
ncbi:unnamed protein product, partial [marine sediment metagenome]